MVNLPAGMKEKASGVRILLLLPLGYAPNQQALPVKPGWTHISQVSQNSRMYILGTVFRQVLHLAAVEEHDGAQRVHGRVAPALVEEAACPVQVLEVLLVRLHARKAGLVSVPFVLQRRVRSPVRDLQQFPEKLLERRTQHDAHARTAN